MAVPALEVFPAEVWIPILRNLVQPVSAPLSAPDRSEAFQTQHSLAAAARTCKLFNTVCTPLLYKVVVTDKLSLFFENSQSPSRRKNLALVEKLYVEYKPEGVWKSYSNLLKLGGQLAWDAFLVGPDEEEVTNMMKASMEVFNLGKMASRLFNEGVRTLCPKLRSIAIASIYGRPSDLWQRYEKWQSQTGLGPSLEATKYQWHRFLAGSGVEHVCVRDTMGPLGQVPLRAILRQKGDNEPLMTLHFSEDVDELSIRPGMPTRWVSDIPTNRPWHRTYYEVARNMIRFAMRRNRIEELIADPSYLCLLDVYFSADILGDPPVGDIAEHITRIAEDAGIPLDPKKKLSLDKQRAVATKIGDYLREWIIDDGCDDFADEIKWHASADAPMCESCGSGPPV